MRRRSEKGLFPSSYIIPGAAFGPDDILSLPPLLSHACMLFPVSLLPSHVLSSAASALQGDAVRGAFGPGTLHGEVLLPQVAVSSRPLPLALRPIYRTTSLRGASAYEVVSLVEVPRLLIRVLNFSPSAPSRTRAMLTTP